MDSEIKQNLKNEIKLEQIQMTKEEREISDRKYAVKLAEIMIFAVSGVMLLTVIGALLAKVINR